MYVFHLILHSEHSDRLLHISSERNILLCREAIEILKNPLRLLSTPPLTISHLITSFPHPCFLCSLIPPCTPCHLHTSTLSSPPSCCPFIPLCAPSHSLVVSTSLNTQSLLSSPPPMTHHSPYPFPFSSLNPSLFLSPMSHCFRSPVSPLPLVMLSIPLPVF